MTSFGHNSKHAAPTPTQGGGRIVLWEFFDLEEIGKLLKVYGKMDKAR